MREEKVRSTQETVKLRRQTQIQSLMQPRITSSVICVSKHLALCESHPCEGVFVLGTEYGDRIALGSVVSHHRVRTEEVSLHVACVQLLEAVLELVLTATAACESGRELEHLFDAATLSAEATHQEDISRTQARDHTNVGCCYRHAQLKQLEFVALALCTRSDVDPLDRVAATLASEDVERVADRDASSAVSRDVQTRH